MIFHTLFFLQVFAAPIVLSYRFVRWFSGALLIHALRLGAYGSLCSDLSQLFCHHAATELRCEGNALVGRIELHFDRWIDHGNLWLFEDENSEKLSFSGEKAGGKLKPFFPCRQNTYSSYGSFWKERFDKVIRSAQIRIAQMLLNQLSWPQVVLDVGCRKLGRLVFDQSQGENLLGWCALEGRS